MDRLVKFTLVGGSGTLINLGLFSLLVDRGGANPTLGAVLCFAVAVTWNYLLDHLWTFRIQMGGEAPSGTRYLRFVEVSLVGLAVDLGGLNLVLLVLHPSHKVIAQAVGIACATAVNYAGASLFAFRPKAERPSLASHRLGRSPYGKGRAAGESK